MLPRFWIITGSIVVCLALAVPAVMAQQMSSEGDRVATPTVSIGHDPALGEASASPNYGTDDFTMFNLSAAAFNPEDSSTTYAYGGNGYIYRTGGSLSLFWAPVVLPAGASFTGFRIFYYDNSSNDIYAYFTRYYGTDSYEDIASWTSSGTPGYSSYFISVGSTISYKDGSGNEQCFVIVVSLPSGSSTMFKGVRLLYYRQVSPAPASATFSDVPVGSQGFAQVEALAASGITAGCDSSHYCPSQPVTRLQMAIYLAKALGLHWTGDEHVAP